MALEPAINLLKYFSIKPWLILPCRQIIAISLDPDIVTLTLIPFQIMGFPMLMNSLIEQKIEKLRKNIEKYLVVTTY